MASYTLSGLGTQSLSGNVTAIHVTINTPAGTTGLGRANPSSYYDVGLLRFGDGTGWWAPVAINGGPQWIGVPSGSTILGYNVFGAVSITVVEVIGGSPPFGTSSLSLEQLTDVSVASVANGQVVTWDSVAGHWKNAAPAGGGGIGAPVLHLDYHEASDLYNASAFAANTWLDVGANHSFTLDRSDSIVLFIWRVSMTNSQGTGGTMARLVVDSGGTPVNLPLGGDQSGRDHAFAASALYSGLASGAHTVKPQLYSSGSGATLYLLPATSPNVYWHILQVLELKTA